MNVIIKIDSFNFVYGVNGGRSFLKFQTKSFNKHKKPLIGDITTIINILRLESDYEIVRVIDVTIKTISKNKLFIQYLQVKQMKVIMMMLLTTYMVQLRPVVIIMIYYSLIIFFCVEYVFIV